LSVARDVTARHEAERAVQESQRLRERIADIIPELVYVYDLQVGATRLVNRQITAVLGYAPDEVQGKPGPVFGDLLHPEDAAAFATHLTTWATVRAGEFREREYRVRHLSGEYRWLRSRETIFTRGPEGEPRELLGMARDVTERKRVGPLLQHQVLDLKQAGQRLLHFRDQLGLTQPDFGARFGGDYQQPISNYENRRVELPLRLLMSIHAQGYALEAVFGTGSTAVLEETVTYLARGYRERVLTRQLAETVLRLVERDVTTIEQALQGLEHPLPPLAVEE